MNLSSLDGNNGFQISFDSNSIQTGIHLTKAQSVSSAGDINGDGFDDLVIGIDDTILGEYSRYYQSVSYVVFGKASGFDAALDLASLDGSNGFRLAGAQFGGLYGYGPTGLQVSNAGDVNGDGFDDLIVGSPSGGSNYAGVSYVVFGQASGFGATLNLAGLDGSNGFRLDGVAANDFSGNPVSNAGDVNGDGFDDLIVGAVRADPYDITDAGVSYVVFGRASGFGATMDLSNLDNGDGLRLDGGARGDFAGASVSGAGDVNSDGFDDLIVGAPGADSNGSNSGASYVLFGSSSFTGTRTFFGTPGDDTLTGTEAIERFSAGDGNDILIGGGGADVINGDAGDDIIRIPNLDFQAVNGGAGNDALELTGSGINLNLDNFRGESPGNFDNTIKGVETIDLTGSGDNTLTVTEQSLVDLLGGNILIVKGNAGDHVAGLSQGWSDGGVQGNFHAYTRHGTMLLIDSTVGTDPLTPSVIDLSNLNGSNGFRLDETGGLRVSVSSAEDVNGDGFDDVIIAASGADSNGENSGSSYVVFGKAAGFDAAMDLSSLDGSNGFRLDGVSADDYSGDSVSNAGDVNGDGFDDVIIGAERADLNVRGSSYVVFGKAAGFDAAMDLSSLDGSNGFRLDGVSAYNSLGDSISNAGDVNGDGFDDVIIGAERADLNVRGSSYVVFGKAAGFDAAMDLASLDGNNGFRLRTSDQDNSFVSSAGDVNGDGFDDLIVGSNNYSSGNFSSSHVVFGRASGFSATLELSTLDGNNGVRLDVKGPIFSVSGAGDVNGDGFDDLIVGSNSYSSGNYSSSYVVFGRSDFGGDGDIDVIQGTAKHDKLTGTAAAEHFKAGRGHDSMIGNGGADIFEGEAGNDYIRVSDLGFGSVDGGKGRDILGLGGVGLNLNLTEMGDRIRDIETIYLFGTGDNTLTVTAADVIDLSSTGNTLKVNGNTGDQIVGLSHGWKDGGIHGGFHTFTDDGAVLLVGVNVATDFV